MDTDQRADRAWLLGVQRKLYQWSREPPDFTRGDRLVVSELSRLGRSLGQIVAILDALAKARSRCAIDRACFTSRGDIYVRSDVALSDATRRALELAIEDRPDGAQVRHSIVNLNHPALIAARAAAVDAERTRMERGFKKRTATGNEREERATELLGKDRRPKFVSIRITWLRNKLGRGR